MKRSRTLAATIALSTIITGGTVISAAEPAMRVTGIIRPGLTVDRLDPISPWLGLVPVVSYQLVQPARLVEPRVDALSFWRMADLVTPGVQRWRGAQFAGHVALSDPRSVGWLSMFWSTDVYRLAQESVSLNVVSMTLTGADGSWQGDLTGAGDPASGAFQLHGTLVGSGGYRGQHMVLDLQTIGSGADWTFHGVVLAGHLPPATALAGPAG